AGVVVDHLARRPRRRSSEELLKHLWRDLDLPKIVSHDLRRTHATLIARFGFGREAIARVLGHADGSVVATHYDKYAYAAEDAAIMARIARHIEGVVSGVESDNVVRLR